jgi:hypothetical protein
MFLLLLFLTTRQVGDKRPTAQSWSPPLLSTWYWVVFIGSLALPRSREAIWHQRPAMLSS